jgi:hypothetical protein
MAITVIRVGQIAEFRIMIILILDYECMLKRSKID